MHVQLAYLQCGQSGSCRLQLDYSLVSLLHMPFCLFKLSLQSPGIFLLHGQILVNVILLSSRHALLHTGLLRSTVILDAIASTQDELVLFTGAYPDRADAFLFVGTWCGPQDRLPDVASPLMPNLTLALAAGSPAVQPAAITINIKFTSDP